MRAVGVDSSASSGPLTPTTSTSGSPPTLTSVGATLLLFPSLSVPSASAPASLFLVSLPLTPTSSFSLSLSLRPGMFTIPLTELLALCVPCPCAGVNGGVHIGIPPIVPELVAATLGTELMTGVGLLITMPDSVAGAKDDCVATLDSELLLVGLPGRTGANEDGLAGNPADGCLDIADAGMLEDVGVGVGVDCVELAAVLIAEG